MNHPYRLIDETNYSILGRFASRGEAVDFVASLLSVNDDDYLDELTIADESGPVLFGESLRDELRGLDGASPSRHGHDEERSGVLIA